MSEDTERTVSPAAPPGSVPTQLRVEGGPDEYVFAKLYTKGHVRADRWYKLWRTILYGSLEDEHPFQTVRRLAEYEDYTLRLLRDAGIRTARPYVRGKEGQALCGRGASCPG